MKELEKIISRTPSFKHQNTFRPNYILITMLILLNFCAEKYPSIFFNINPFQHQHALHFGILNYEKKKKKKKKKNIDKASVKFWEVQLFMQFFLSLPTISKNHRLSFCSDINLGLFRISCEGNLAIQQLTSMVINSEPYQMYKVEKRVIA